MMFLAGFFIGTLTMFVIVGVFLIYCIENR